MVIVDPQTTNLNATLVGSWNGPPTQAITSGVNIINWPTITPVVDEHVSFTGGSLPAEIIAGTTYYVVAPVTATTTSLSATRGGAAMTITTGGSGTATRIRGPYTDLWAYAVVSEYALVSCIGGQGISWINVTQGVHTAPVELAFFPMPNATSGVGAPIYDIKADIQNVYVVGEGVPGFHVIDCDLLGDGAAPTSLGQKFAGNPRDVVTFDHTLETATWPGGTVLVEDERVRLETTDTLPAALTAGDYYYLVSVAANVAELSLTAGGASILLADNGTGDHTAHRGAFLTAHNCQVEVNLAGNSSLYVTGGNSGTWRYTMSSPGSPASPLPEGELVQQDLQRAKPTPPPLDIRQGMDNTPSTYSMHLVALTEGSTRYVYAVEPFNRMLTIYDATALPPTVLGRSQTPFGFSHDIWPGPSNWPNIIPANLPTPTYTRAPETVTISSASPAVITWTGAAPALGRRFTLSGGTLPEPFVAGVHYFVLNPSGSTSNLAQEKGGTAINSVAASAPTVTATEVFQIICSTTDEIRGSGVSFYDLSDKTHPVLLSSITVDRRTIPHNSYVSIDGLKCYVSWYTEGFVRIDISDPKNPVVDAKYDTTPGGAIGGAFQGAWGVHPFLLHSGPNGDVSQNRVLVSDILGGLSILDLT